VYRVRPLAQEFLAELAGELELTEPTRREMFLWGMAATSAQPWAADIRNATGNQLGSLSETDVGNQETKRSVFGHPPFDFAQETTSHFVWGIP